MNLPKMVDSNGNVIQLDRWIMGALLSIVMLISGVVVGQIWAQTNANTAQINVNSQRLATLEAQQRIDVSAIPDIQARLSSIDQRMAVQTSLLEQHLTQTQPRQ